MDTDEGAKRCVELVKRWAGGIADVELVPGTQNQIRKDVVLKASGLGDDEAANEKIYTIPRPNGDVILGGTSQQGNRDVR
ncbi:hypothetical protein FRB97_001054 [Tulasnella sp. 331]|nr:hypothetical protein FRB97_001054 [Tulasnella sp. 331]